jgi:hypothetical protein
MQESEHVEAILKALVTSAKHSYRAAKHEFWVVCSHQLDVERQKGREATAATARSLSEEKLLDALVRLNRFLMSETIPEELKYLDAPGKRTMGASS